MKIFCTTSTHVASFSVILNIIWLKYDIPSYLDIPSVFGKKYLDERSAWLWKEPSKINFEKLLEAYSESHIFSMHWSVMHLLCWIGILGFECVDCELRIFA